jgi:hypothetical protein
MDQGYTCDMPLRHTYITDYLDEDATHKDLLMKIVFDVKEYDDYFM